MVSIVERSITGFKFNPILKKVRGKEQLVGLKVEYLEDGELIAREIFQHIDEVQLERLKLQLLELCIINLGLEKNWTESKKISKRNRVLGVANMFKIETLKEQKDGKKDIRVQFFTNGSFLAESDFKEVTESKLDKIRQLLSDNTAYNLTVQRQCNAVTWLDLIAVINGIVEKN